MNTTVPLAPAIGWAAVAALMVGLFAYHADFATTPPSSLGSTTAQLAEVTTSRKGVHILLRQSDGPCWYVYPWAHGNGGVVQRLLQSSKGVPVTLTHRKLRGEDPPVVLGVEIEAQVVRSPAESDSSRWCNYAGLGAFSLAVAAYAIVRLRRALVSP